MKKIMVKLRYCHQICVGGLKETMQTLMISSVLSKIQVKTPQNTSTEMDAAAEFSIINDFVIVTKV
jgi:molybdenum cofactor biosynthesis enzyme